MKKIEQKIKKKCVTLLSQQKLLLQCEVCHGVWAPMVQPGGRLPRRYWECPHGKCNGSKVS